jgi:hypothetical protein
VDDSRLLQLICWSMSSQSMSITPGGGGSIRREDVWQMIGACRRFVNDPGPDLLLLEAGCKAVSDLAKRDTSSIAPPVARIEWVRDRIAWEAGKRSKFRDKECEDRVLFAAADYALAKMAKGRNAGQYWTVPAVAKRLGLRTEDVGKVLSAAESGLWAFRDEAMARFRREVLAARRA